MTLKGLHFVDVAEIQEAVTDELRNVQKKEFSAAFQKLYDGANAYICGSGAYFEFRKGTCLLFLKKWTAVCTIKYCTIRFMNKVF
jgi:hypothetical protein